MENNSTPEQKWYDKTWLVVVLCIFFFPVGLYALWKNASIAKGWKIGVTAFFALAVIANLASKKDGDKTASTSTTSTTETTTTEATTEKAEPKSMWSYSEDEDKMDGTKRYFGSCVSTNEVDFEFPYNGGSSFTLTVRNMGQGNEVVLQVSKGQFMTSIGASETFRAKFDDGQPMNFSYNSASDGSMDVIFLNNSAKFISQLKQAKKLMLEVQFFNAGNKLIYFDVAGLNWDK